LSIEYNDIPLRIREAGTGDIPLLVALGRRTFYEAFRDFNTEENMTMFLDEQFRDEVLEREMEEAGAVFFIIYHNTEPIGFSKVRVGHEPPELAGLNALEIERIYVDKGHQDKKAGTAMMRHNIAYAKENGFGTIWLGVWEHNPHAIRFYERNGFLAFGDHIFKLGKDPQRDILMKKDI